jgi:hypothetical protein
MHRVAVAKQGHTWDVVPDWIIHFAPAPVNVRLQRRKNSIGNPKLQNSPDYRSPQLQKLCKSFIQK